MGRQEKLLQESIKAINLINEVKNSTKKENILVEVTANECGDTIFFKFNNGKIVEYSLSEIGYIFEDDLEGFGIFTIEDYKDIYDNLKLIQKEIEIL
ncbi:hypothetical protein [Clostridium saudiense]|uniref:hypothetical protein n=1 Tax=Clostridium saudiense TaxID=1414720 RepID=UPI0026739D19|nr:hypothetical protein [Clostridium saudiense]